MALTGETSYPFESSLDFANHLQGFLSLSSPTPLSPSSPLSTTLLSDDFKKSTITLPSEEDSPCPKKGDLCVIDFLNGDLPLPLSSSSLSPSPSSSSSPPLQSFLPSKKQRFEFVLGEGTAHFLLELLLPTMKVGETALVSPSPSPNPSSFFLQATLLSIKPPPQSTFTAHNTQALRLKEEANTAFRIKDYLDAHSQYLDSISLSLSIPRYSLATSCEDFASYFNLVVALLLNKGLCEWRMKAYSEALSSFHSVLHLCGGKDTDETWEGREGKGEEKEGEGGGSTPLSFYHPTIIVHRSKAHYRMGMVYLSMENFEKARRHLSFCLSLSGEDQNAKNGLVKVGVEEEKKKKREKKLYSNMFG